MKCTGRAAAVAVRAHWPNVECFEKPNTKIAQEPLAAPAFLLPDFTGRLAAGQR